MNEILYMEMRLLQQFCAKYRLEPIKVNRIFNQNDIWKYIEDCYDTLHCNGDEYILNDIDEILMAKGVTI